MSGKFQLPPIQGQPFLDENSQAPSFAWMKWFELIAAALSETPAPKTAASPGTPGQIAFDANFVYVCVAKDSWTRVGLGAW